MLEEFQTLLSDIKTNVEEILKNKDRYGDTSGVDLALSEVLSEALIEAGKKAIDSIPEYEYPPLKNRFLENLSKPEHIKISGNRVHIFDESVAGTYAELLSGQDAARGHTGTPQAPASWKYGIYMPSQEGGGWSDSMISRLGLPTYSEIIETRLAKWGDKSPYWYFIENGNAGNSRAYPSFGGTGFIDQLRSKVPDIIRRAKEIYYNRIFYDIADAVELGAMVNPKSRTRVTIYRYKVGSVNISIQKSSAGNYFYRIGRKNYSFSEFQEIIKTLI